MLNIKCVNSAAAVLLLQAKQRVTQKPAICSVYSFTHSFIHWADINQALNLSSSIIHLILIGEQSEHTLSVMKFLFPQQFFFDRNYLDNCVNFCVNFASEVKQRARILTPELYSGTFQITEREERNIVGPSCHSILFARSVLGIACVSSIWLTKTPPCSLWLWMQLAPNHWCDHITSSLSIPSSFGQRRCFSFQNSVFILSLPT